MSESFEKLKSALRKLPGTGMKSAERMALHLALENQSDAREIASAIITALDKITPCPVCGGLSENGGLCDICKNPARAESAICVVERASDIDAIEKSGAWRGRYHVLGGKLSPLKKIGADKLNMESLARRLEGGEVEEIMLALSNDIEGKATCLFIQDHIVGTKPVKLTRIGFGLPSGSQLGFADSETIKNALDSRKSF